MSVQQLLPKDVLVRSLCICIENTELPVTYQSADGPVKGRNAKTLLTGALKPEVESRLGLIGEIVKSGNVGGQISKTKLDANHQAWLFARELFSGKFRAPNQDKESSGNIDSDISASLAVSIERIGNWTTRATRQRISDSISDTIPLFSKFEKLADSLELLRDGYNSRAGQKIKSWKRNGSMGEIELLDEYSKLKPVKYFQVGSVVLVTMMNRAEVTKSFLMTSVHYSRVVDMVKSFGSLTLSLPYIYGTTDFENVIDQLLELFIRTGVDHPNAVGGIFKTARQLLFLMGDKSSIMGSSAFNMHISGLSGPKLELGEKVADRLFTITNDRKSAVNLANMFKAVLHPDTDMKAVFESIMGSKDPNKVDPRVMQNFIGITRKAVYSSLSKQRYNIRVVANDPENNVTRVFADQVNSTSVPTSTVMKAGYTKWAGVTFQPIRGLFDDEHQDIPVSNKASAPDAQLSYEDIALVDEIRTMSELKDLREKLRAVNDVVTAIEGTCELGFKSARKKFRSVIREHEAFERKYLNEGVSIDDIPSDDLSEFVKGSVDRSYTVLTEPKLGEVHKEVTRLFYMAQQSLKVMTQVCERFTKKVISKSSGVSITKTYRARRKELESMLYAYTGFVTTDEGGAYSVYISFDMSEFSKKFPNILVREVGKVLSELSGEDWMSRIDVFFRAAVVYNNTRGFLGATSGIKGGFEGFLNFLWTLIMKVVMDIASHSTGVEGVLAVYSDDGLLRLTISGGKHVVAQKVIKIQEIFANHGLIFHMDKTVASTEILEYLGVYAEKGMILATWVKELMSIGKRKNTPGVSTVADKVMLWTSQCGALVKAGGPTYMSHFLNTYLAVRTIRRLNRVAPSMSLAALTIIPFSAGGFRVPSITQVSLLSAIDPLAEFSSDVELLYDLLPSQTTCIAERIILSLKGERSAEKSLVTGSLLQTTLADTSGMSVIRELIDKSDIPVSGSRDPMTGPILREILSRMSSGKNISVRPIRDLVQSVPAMIEFNKSIALMKSSAALKFVEKSDIMRAQSKDTRKCRESIREWVEEMRCFEGKFKRIKSTDLSFTIIRKSYPSYDIADLTDSPRTSLTVTDEDPDIISTIEMTDTAKLTDQLYIEPEAKFLGAQLTPEFVAESAANTKQRQNERFVSSAARLVASNPSFLGIYYTIANAFGLPCPTLPSVTVVSSHRSTRNFGYNAVACFIPAPFHALVKSRMSNTMWRKIAAPNAQMESPRSDKTTYVESANLATYLNTYYYIDNSKIQKEGVEVIMYKVRDIVSNTRNPIMSIDSVPDFKLIDDKTTSTFTTILVEEEAQRKHLESLTTTIGMLECINDTPLSKAILLTRLEGWLYANVRGGVDVNVGTPPTMVPTIWQREIYTEAAVSVGFRMSSASSRSRLSRKLSKALNLMYGCSCTDAMDNWHIRNLVGDAIEDCRTSWDEVNFNVMSVASALSTLPMGESLTIELNELDINTREGTVLLLSTLQRESITGGDINPTTVINTDTFADTKMTKSVRTAIQRATYMKLQAQVEVASKIRDPAALLIADTNINFLTVIKNMIRPSGHRDTPFNKHMVALQMIKLEFFINKCLREGLEEVNTEMMSHYRLDKAYVRRIKNLNAVIGGRANMTTGEDMRQCIESQGIPHWAISRVNYILSRIGDHYLANSITAENLMGDEHFMQNLLTFVTHGYNTMLKSAMSRIEIIHTRESATLAKRVIASPVEEASMITADVDFSEFVALEYDIEKFKTSSSFKDVLSSLFMAHYYRWGTDGYTGAPWINDILKSEGLWGKNEVELRGLVARPFNKVELKSPYTLSISKYTCEDTLIHNYLMINGIPGGMSVMAREDDDLFLIAIIPSGIVTIDTELTKKPNYRGDTKKSIVITVIKKTAASLRELTTVLGARARVVVQTGDFSALVLQQAYQRVIGARTTVVEDDHTLVAISELALGAWSLDSGFRTLALFASWFCTEGEVSKRVYYAFMGEIRRMSVSPNAVERSNVNHAASAVFEWLRMVNIRGGSGIDTVRVTAIVNTVSRSVIAGGAPSAIYNYAPKDVGEVSGDRGSLDLVTFIEEIVPTLFLIPVPSAMLEYNDDQNPDSDSGDDWV
jgi:hypothetical protein